MTISIRIADTAGDLDGVLQLRHQVYVDEEQRFTPHPGGRFFDRFDCFPSTCSVIARDISRPGSPVAGTLRFAIKTEAGLPSDSFYDFSNVTKGLEGGIATVGMLAVGRNFRERPGIVLGMFKVAIRELRARGGRHVVAPVSPDIEPLLRAAGAQQVGDVIYHGDPPVQMTPIHADLDAFPPFFRESALDPQNILFDKLKERRMIPHGEVLLREGEPGDEAFLIMRGSVRVFTGPTEAPHLICLHGPGQIIGEMSLLDGGPRTATVVVHSRLLDVAVIPKAQFQARLAADPEFNRRMLTILGQRSRKVLVNLPPDSLLEYDLETLAANLLLEASEGGTKPVEPGWLAAECGLKAEELEEILTPWENFCTVRRNQEGLIELADPKGLNVFVDRIKDRVRRSIPFTEHGSMTR